MLDLICKALAAGGADLWTVRRIRSRSAELFFIKTGLDTRRITDTEEYEVTVYKDFEEDGKPMRGSSLLHVSPAMGPEEIVAAVKNALFSAGLAKNPFFELADPVTAPQAVPHTALSALTPEQAAEKAAAALFAAGGDGASFLNSAEIFAVRTQCRILNSRGTDVSYERSQLKGEFVVQCVAEEDVELYRHFAYDDLEEEALTALGAEALQTVRARAKAKPVLPGGEYDLILSGEQVGELFSYYLSRSSAGMVYSHYSNYAPGARIQGEDRRGEALNLTLLASAPYSPEGVPMTDRPLITDGVLDTLQGPVRFCRYLGMEPTGSYGKLRMTGGTRSLAELKERPYLQAVQFSDFQMDPFTGHFGGEIRLAYWFDGQRVREITGGSVNGVLTEVQDDLLFSREQYADDRYEGPFAVRIPGVKVAGI